MDENNRNFILAIVLSIGVLFGWQYFFVPRHPPQAPATQTAQQQPAQQPVQPGAPQPSGESGAPVPAPGAGLPAGAPQTATQTRDEALASAPRVAIDTPGIKGSV